MAKKISKNCLFCLEREGRTVDVGRKKKVENDKDMPVEELNKIIIFKSVKYFLFLVSYSNTIETFFEVDARREMFDIRGYLTEML